MVSLKEAEAKESRENGVNYEFNMNFPIFVLCLSTVLITGAQDSTTPCSQFFLGRLGHGVINSYNYPFDYRHNLTCTYSIYLNNSPGNSKTICFQFHRFQLEGSTPYCTFDSLKVDDVKYCASGLWQYGTEDSPQASLWSNDFCWTAKGATFDLIFSTDNNINAAGFSATFEVHDGAHAEGTLAPHVDGYAPCAEQQWTCFNRRCIESNLRCNGNDDCGDGSDEAYAHARCGEQNVLACDFSNRALTDGYCGFTHEGWFRTDTKHSPYGPKGDHTNTTHGFYVYTDVNESSAYLLSPELSLPRNKTYCLTFWYFIYGRPAAAVLRVYTSRAQAYSRPEWSRSQARENVWQRGQVVVKTGSALQVIFAAELDNSFSGVSLDDISVLEGYCSGDDMSCNFEMGTCSWKLANHIRHLHGDLYADLAWRIHNRLLAPVGPFGDHSSRDGGGYYLYVNSSSKPSDSRALLVSRPVSGFPGQKRCLRFWYHMEGYQKACCQLRVKVHKVDSSLSEAAWSQNGDVRNAWKQAYVNIEPDGPFELVLEGIVAYANRGEIAVDEILLQDGECIAGSQSACETGQYLCSNGRCINATLKCDGHQDCEDGSDENWRADCPQPTEVPATDDTCAATHYQCHSDGACIPNEWLCDTFNDCGDMSDEDYHAGCEGKTAPTTTKTSCDPSEYRCFNGDCVGASLYCDGRSDCLDKSDETNCTGSGSGSPVPAVCGQHYFQCLYDKACVSINFKCDGTKDCLDGTDESSHHCGGSAMEAGPVAGIALAVIFVVIVCIIAALVTHRRRKSQPHPHLRRRAVDRDVSTISRSYVDSTMERQVNALENMRSPMQGSEPPPYGQGNLENHGYTPEHATTGHAQQNARNEEREGHDLPPDDPPPPYDAVVKENLTGEETEPSTSHGTHNRSSRHGSGRRLRSRSRSRSREHSRSPPRGSRRSSYNRHSNPVLGPGQGGVTAQRPLPATPVVLPSPPAQTQYATNSRPQRIRLGTQALHRGNRPRNYYDYNQRPAHYNSDSQSLNSTLSDHIYETLDHLGAYDPPIAAPAASPRRDYPPMSPNSVHVPLHEVPTHHVDTAQSQQPHRGLPHSQSYSGPPHQSLQSHLPQSQTSSFVGRQHRDQLPTPPVRGSSLQDTRMRGLPARTLHLEDVPVRSETMLPQHHLQDSINSLTPSSHNAFASEGRNSPYHPRGGSNISYDNRSSVALLEADQHDEILSATNV